MCEETRREDCGFAGTGDGNHGCEHCDFRCPERLSWMYSGDSRDSAAAGLLVGRWCLDPEEELSDGQMEEIDRVCAAYPGLQDDAFVAENLGRWLG